MKCISAVILFLLSVSLFSGCGERKPQPDFRLTYSVFFPPSHINARLAKEWAEEIENATSNRVKILVFAGASLTAANQCYNGVIDGISDIGMSCFSYTPGRFPLLEGLDLPVGYPDGLTASRITNMLAMKYPPKDTRLLYTHAHGPGVLAVRRGTVLSLPDFAKLKTRGTGLTARIIQSLGGAAIGMSQPETYDALSKGVVDATLCPMETLKGWGQGECIETVTTSPALGYTTTVFVAMNLDTWNSLPADIQEIFKTISSKYVEKHGIGWDTADKEAKIFLDELGKKQFALSDAENDLWTARLQPVFNDYISRAAKKGVDTRQFLAELRAAVSNAKNEKE